MKDPSEQLKPEQHLWRFRFVIAEKWDQCLILRTSSVIGAGNSLREAISDRKGFKTTFQDARTLGLTSQRSRRQGYGNSAGIPFSIPPFSWSHHFWLLPFKVPPAVRDQEFAIFGDLRNAVADNAIDDGGYRIVQCIWGKLKLQKGSKHA